MKSSSQQKLEVLQYGQGEPLLLLPPIDGIATSWMSQFKALSDRFQLFVVHYPGYGRSEFNSDTAHFSAIASDAIGALDACGIRGKVHVAGWSMGGMIAQVIAKQHAERVKTLTLVNTTAFLDEEESVENIYALATKVRADFEENLPKSMLDYRDALLQWIKGCYVNEVSLHYHLQVLKFDNRDELRNITVPTLIISGGKDQLTPPQYSVWMQQQIKDAEHDECERGGHYIPLQNAEYFNKKLVEFIESKQKEEIQKPSEEMAVR